MEIKEIKEEKEKRRKRRKGRKGRKRRKKKKKEEKKKTLSTVALHRRRHQREHLCLHSSRGFCHKVSGFARNSRVLSEILEFWRKFYLFKDGGSSNTS